MAHGAMMVTLAEAEAVGEAQVVLVQMLPPITAKPLVDVLPSKVATQLTRIHLRLAIMHLVAEVAEVTNTEVMDV